MNSVEINGSFYSLQRRSNFEAWKALVPDDFVFAVKGGRFITHMKKLSGIETPLANFFASGVCSLSIRSWVRSCGSCHRTSASTRIGWTLILAALPRTAGSAAKIAGDHDQRVPDDRALIKATRPKQRLRHAVEVRHESFRNPEFYKLLSRHKIALVVADNPGQWPIITEITADLMYVRLRP